MDVHSSDNSNALISKTKNKNKVQNRLLQTTGLRILFRIMKQYSSTDLHAFVEHHLFISSVLPTGDSHKAFKFMGMQSFIP